MATQFEKMIVSAKVFGAADSRGGQINVLVTENTLPTSHNSVMDTQNLQSMIGFFNVGAVNLFTVKRDAAPSLTRIAGKPAVRPVRAARPATARQSQTVALARCIEPSGDDWTDY